MSDAVWMNPTDVDALPRKPDPFLVGQIGAFYGIPIFTDCALLSGAVIHEGAGWEQLTEGAPHSCGDRPCSRKKREQTDAGDSL